MGLSSAESDLAEVFSLHMIYEFVELGEKIVIACLHYRRPWLWQLMNEWHDIILNSRKSGVLFTDVWADSHGRLALVTTFHSELQDFRA